MDGLHTGGTPGRHLTSRIRTHTCTGTRHSRNLLDPSELFTQAATPTLIQHGEFDRRVPIPNAYELYQGLQDMGVDTKLIVYKGFGHGITKPKERLAAMWHNWQWFGKYLWSEKIELPLGDDEQEDEETVTKRSEGSR